MKRDLSQGLLLSFGEELSTQVLVRSDLSQEILTGSEFNQVEC